MLTDNEVLVRNYVKCPTLMCVQRKAQKKIVTEGDLIEANINSFGSEVGKITNRVTSMFEVQSHFDEDSREYKELEYRIKTGQNFQQNSIDKTKGIIAKPMPREWFDRHAANAIKDENKKALYMSILADKKPKFMIYVYDHLRSEYLNFIKSTNKKCIRNFTISLEELCSLPEDVRTPEQNEFLESYRKSVPVGIGNCVMNIICQKFEDRFDNYLKEKTKDCDFDYEFMKSGVEYSKKSYRSLVKVFDDYDRRMNDYKKFSIREHLDEDEYYKRIAEIDETFKAACSEICSNSKTLCDMLLDICYRDKHKPRFVWAVCGEDIVDNLLRKNNNIIHYPEMDENGDIEFRGNKFTLKEKEIGNDEYSA